MGVNIENSRYNLFFSEDDKRNANKLLQEFNITEPKRVVVVAPGAKSHTKRWSVASFAKLCHKINKELGVKVLLAGDLNDKDIISQILSSGLNDSYDISARTNLRELAFLILQCGLLVSNDSSPLHIADLVKTPCLSIFGPTDHLKYGPTLAESVVLRKDIKCAPCEKAQCPYALQCLKQVTSDEAFEIVKSIIKPTQL